jgi:hypothetical protein
LSPRAAVVGAVPGVAAEGVEEAGLECAAAAEAEEE